MAINKPVEGHDVPDSYQNLDEIKPTSPVRYSSSSTRDGPSDVGGGVDPSNPHQQTEHMTSRTGDNDNYDARRDFANLTELAPDPPVENPDEAHQYRHRSLEENIGRTETAHSGSKQNGQNSKFLTEAITASYLVLFSILGTLARLGLTSLTTYTGAPIVFGNLWPNVAGTLILSFLSEGAQLFGHPPAKRSIVRPGPSSPGTRTRESSNDTSDTSTEEPPQPLPVPLHIGLATGFCGSLTTFSGFIEECFLALSNSAEVPIYHPGAVTSKIAPRGPGLDFMAIAAVIIVTIATCCASLKVGAHLAILLRQWRSDKHVPCHLYWVDRLTMALSIGVCMGAIIMTVLPPDRLGGPLWGASTARDKWRGQLLFAIVFAPLGCIARFYASATLNSKIVGFPLGTFFVNMLGVLVLAMT